MGLGVQDRIAGSPILRVTAEHAAYKRGAPFFASRQRVGDENVGDNDTDMERSLATTETAMIQVANGILHTKSVPHPSGVPEEWGTRHTHWRVWPHGPR